MKIKGTLCLLAATVGIFSGSIAAFAANNDNIEYKQSIETLEAINVINGYTVDNAENNLSRIEWARMLAHIVSPDDNYYYEKEAKYQDVGAGDKAVVSMLADRNIMNGYNEYTFNPDKPVMYIEALKALVSITGHGITAENHGGWPIGYSACAGSIGISKGIKNNSDHEITIGEAAKLIENAIKTDIMTVNVSGETPIYTINEDENLLGDNFHIYEGEGILKTNEYTDIYGGNSANKNNVRIDEDIYILGDKKFNDYLGHKIKFYYSAKEKDDSERELIYAYDVNTVNTFTLKSNEVDSYSAGVYQYTLDTEKRSRRLNIASDAVVLYNYRVPINKSGNELYLPKEGKIDLIDNDGDNRYDVVFIWDYQTYVVNTISAETYTINDFYGKEPLVLNPDNVDYTMTKDGNNIGVDKLEKWNVLSVAKSDDNDPYITVVVTDKRVTGQPSFTEDSVTINNKEYRLSSVFNQRKKVSSEIDFYLDFLENVVAYDKNSDSDRWYQGIITNAYYEESMDRPEVKIYTEEGAMVKYKTTEKINLDGEQNVKSVLIFQKGKYNQLMDEQGLKPQLIKYRINKNNEVTHVDTVEKGAREDDDSLNQSPFLKRDSGWQAMILGHSWNETYAIVSGATIFRVPSDSEGNIMKGSEYDKYYEINHYAGWNYQPFVDHYTDYSVRFFNINETNVSDTMIWYVAADGSEDQFTGEQFMIKSKGSMVNNDDEVVTTLKGWRVGQEATLVFESGKDDLVESLKEGDIINYVLNNFNEVTNIKRIVNPSDKDENGYPAYMLSESAWDNGIRCLYGQITSIDRENHVIMVKYKYDEFGEMTGDGIVNVLDGTGHNAVVTKYHSDRNTMESGTWEDLQVGQSVILDKHETATRSITIIEED